MQGKNSVSRLFPPRDTHANRLKYVDVTIITSVYCEFDEDLFNSLSTYLSQGLSLEFTAAVSIEAAKER